MRSSLNGKIKGLGSYGKYGRASSYPGQRSKRRQKVRTQGHAGQLENVREVVPNIPSLHEKIPRPRGEKKKREKDFKKRLKEKKHTHTHNARASQKCVLKKSTTDQKKHYRSLQPSTFLYYSYYSVYKANNNGPKRPFKTWHKK